jgi:hypothetical protein
LHLLRAGRLSHLVEFALLKTLQGMHVKYAASLQSAARKQPWVEKQGQPLRAAPGRIPAERGGGGYPTGAATQQLYHLSRGVDKMRARSKRFHIVVSLRAFIRVAPQGKYHRARNRWHV